MRLGVASRTGSIAALAGAMMLTLNSGGLAEDATQTRQHITKGKMTEGEWYAFVAGIIEGVAFHRYNAAGKDAAIMNCIYDWFYKEDGTDDTIYATLGKYPDYPPAAVVDALAKRKCGGE